MIKLMIYALIYLIMVFLLIWYKLINMEYAIIFGLLYAFILGITEARINLEKDVDHLSK